MKNRHFILLLVIVMMLSGCTTKDNSQVTPPPSQQETNQEQENTNSQNSEQEPINQNNSAPESEELIETSYSFNLEEIPEFTDKPYIVINNNTPFFQKDTFVLDKDYEFYSPLDALNRCGMTIASVGKETMPTEKRGSIGQIKPSGWQIIKYDFVDQKYLYNRCHLIGYQLTAENDNPKNLITGTRYMNVEGMLPFENMVADYVKETENHVLYRVTPIFKDNELVARGVLIEAQSIEDDGDGIMFNVFAYNSQPGVIIDYSTGKSALNESEANSSDNQNTNPQNTEGHYVLNTRSHKIHDSKCPSVEKTAEHNKKEYIGNINDLLSEGYEKCQQCNPN